MINSSIVSTRNSHFLLSSFSFRGCRGERVRARREQREEGGRRMRGAYRESDLEFIISPTRSFDNITTGTETDIGRHSNISQCSPEK
jgi:hypothetical protein